MLFFNIETHGNIRFGGDWSVVGVTPAGAAGATGAALDGDP